MRLSPRLIKLINSAKKESFGDVEIYLFGSRVNDFKRGGDIDLAIKTSVSRDIFRRQKAKFLAFLMRRDYDLSIDLVQFHKNMDELLYFEINQNKVKL